MSSLDAIEALLKDQSALPPIEKWHPELSGDIDIVIAADGRWIHEGGEIKRPKLVQLFASILRREADGHYYLVTPVEKWRLKVDDLPLQIVDFELADTPENSRLLVKTNVDTWFELGREHPLEVNLDAESGEPRPQVNLIRGLAARVNRSCFYALVEMGREEDGRLKLDAGGCSFDLGSLRH